MLLRMHTLTLGVWCRNMAPVLLLRDDTLVQIASGKVC